MVELEHARMLLDDMGLHTAAELLMRKLRNPCTGNTPMCSFSMIC